MHLPRLTMSRFDIMHITIHPYKAYCRQMIQGHCRVYLISFLLRKRTGTKSGTACKTYSLGFGNSERV